MAMTLEEQCLKDIILVLEDDGGSMRAHIARRIALTRLARLTQGSEKKRKPKKFSGKVVMPSAS